MLDPIQWLRVEDNPRSSPFSLPTFTDRDAARGAFFAPLLRWDNPQSLPYSAPAA